MSRPYPRIRKFHGDILDDIDARYSEHPLLARMRTWIFTPPRNARMSWSVAGMEFALGLERPVLFVDVPRKIRYPDYRSLDIEPLEARIRSEIGQVVGEDSLEKLGNEASKMAGQGKQWQQAIRQARSRWIYNPDNSGRVAAQYIHGLFEAGGL